LGGALEREEAKLSLVVKRGVGSDEELDNVSSVKLHTNTSGARTDRHSGVPAEIATPVDETGRCRSAVLVLHAVFNRHQLSLQLRHARFLR